MVAAPPPPPPEGPGRLALGGLLLLAVTAAVYGPALRGEFIWDDHDWIVENVLLQDLEGLRRIWLEPRAFHQYYPLTHTSFWVEHHLWGTSTLGYHLVNVALHALNATLLWRVLRGLGLRGAALAALLYAVHPVMVESVAWITERKNVLSMALALGSLHCALPWLTREAARPWDRPRRAAAASALFAAALLAKTAVAPLPALLLLLRWWRHGRLRAPDLLGMAPWLGGALGLGLVTAWLERVEVGAHGASWATSPAERVLVAGRAAWFYAGKLVLPVDLAFIYPRWTPSLGEPLQLLAPGLALGLLISLYLGRHRLGRGPFTAWAAFLGLLSPALGFVDVYAQRFSFVADHWSYHAAPALLAAGAHLAASAPVPRRAGLVAAALLAALLGGLGWQQAQLYADPERLYRDTLEKNPDSALAHANLAVILSGRGERAEALAHLREAWRLSPDDPVVALNLGVSLDLAGADAEARDVYQALLAVRPDEAQVVNALADLLARSRDPAVFDPGQAVVLARRAMVLAEPAPSQVHATLVQALRAAGQAEEARAAAAAGLRQAQAEGNAQLEGVFRRWLAR